MEERIKAIYNDCWKMYKEYLSSHDMAACNENMKMLADKYDRKEDICDLLWWFGLRINKLHKEYMGKEKAHGGYVK